MKKGRSADCCSRKCLHGLRILQRIKKAAADVLMVDPPDGLRLFTRALPEREVKRQDIETMVKKNPAKLLNFAKGFHTRS